MLSKSLDIGDLSFARKGEASDLASVRGCSCRKTAELRGFVRSFNKLSGRNWGTRDNPGPTLNLIAGEGSCRGIAFEFPENRRSDIYAYLSDRKGIGFALRGLPIVVEGGAHVKAIVPIYTGRNVTSTTDTSRSLRWHSLVRERAARAFSMSRASLIISADWASKIQPYLRPRAPSEL